MPNDYGLAQQVYNNLYGANGQQPRATSTISDALSLPRLPDQTNSFSNVANANAVGNEATQTLNDQGQADKAGQAPQSAFHEVKYTANKEGGFDVAVKMPSQTYDYLGNLLQTGKAAQDAFATARAEAMAKRQFMEQHPIVSALGKIASTAAAQYGSGVQGMRMGRIDPLVRAAGAYGLEQFGQTSQQLAQEEAGLAQQQYGIAQNIYNQYQQDEALSQTRQREDRRDKEAQQRFQLGVTSDLSRDARQGLIRKGDEPMVAKQLLQSGAAKNPEEAQAIAASLATVGERRNELNDLAARQKEERDQAKSAFELQKLEIMQKAQTDRMLAGFANAQQLAQMRLDHDDKKVEAKTKEVPKPINEKLANLSAAEKSLDNVEAGLRKYKDLQGIVAGRVAAPIAKYVNREAARFFTNLKLEVAQTIKSTGAGARGFGPMERPFFERLATAQTHSLEENLGVIDAWRDYIKQNRSAYLESYIGLNEPQYRKAFGKDTESLFGPGEGAAPAGAPPPGSNVIDLTKK